MKLRIGGIGILSVLAAIFGAGVQAGDALEHDYLCPKTDIWSSLLDRIPLGEILPVTIGGASMGGDSQRIPGAAFRTPVCACKNSVGFEEAGVTVGYWEVAYLVELVRTKGCSPVLGGEITLSGIDTQALGGSGSGEYGASDLTFYHAHVFSFPLFRMLNLFTDLSCGNDDYFDLDLLYMSELDPAWSNEYLSLKTTPELKGLASKEAVESCAIDAEEAYKGEINDELFYCAGAWGFLYPLAGYGTNGGAARDTSLLLSRVLTLLHRRGLMRKTVGSSAMCGSVYENTPTKSAYRFSLLYPIAENSSTHAWGEPVELWHGDQRIPPGFSDVVYVVWRYKNCCLGVD